MSAFKNIWDIGPVVAGFGYIADSFGKFLLPNYNVSLAQFTFVGEALLILWLLWRGIKGFENAPKKT